MFNEELGSSCCCTYSQERALQKNACVALISIIQLGPQCWQAAVKESAVSPPPL